MFYAMNAGTFSGKAVILAYGPTPTQLCEMLAGWSVNGGLTHEEEKAVHAACANENAIFECCPGRSELPMVSIGEPACGLLDVTIQHIPEDQWPGDEKAPPPVAKPAPERTPLKQTVGTVMIAGVAVGDVTQLTLAQVKQALASGGYGQNEGLLAATYHGMTKNGNARYIVTYFDNEDKPTACYVYVRAEKQTVWRADY